MNTAHDDLRLRLLLRLRARFGLRLERLALRLLRSRLCSSSRTATLAVAITDSVVLFLRVLSQHGFLDAAADPTANGAAAPLAGGDASEGKGKKRKKQAAAAVAEPAATSEAEVGASALAEIGASVHRFFTQKNCRLNRKMIHEVQAAAAAARARTCQSPGSEALYFTCPQGVDTDQQRLSRVLRAKLQSTEKRTRPRGVYTDPQELFGKLRVLARRAPMVMACTL